MDNIARETYLGGCLVCCVVDLIFCAMKCRKFPLGILGSKRTFCRAPSAGSLAVIKIATCHNCDTNDVNKFEKEINFKVH